MRGANRLFEAITAHSRIVIVLLLVSTLAVGAGISNLETSASLQQFEGDSVESQKLEYADENFSSVRENVTIAQIVVRDDNVLDKESLVKTLELQQRIRQNESISGTLAADRPTTGIANVVARTAIRKQDPTRTSPSLDAQIAQLESMSSSEVEAVVEAVLSENEDGPSSEAFVFMSTDYEAGETTANATMVVVFQSQETDAVPGQAPDRIVESQTAMQQLVADGDVGEKSFVVGNGIISDEMKQSQKDSMQIVGPLALLFVLVTLTFAYRDLLDVLLGVFGIALVLVWTFGFLGWAGIPFNPSFIAVPVLLIGLSIDYAIHVFMRYREERADGTGVREAMTGSLTTVGVALVWVTVTTVIGFLSNLVSPLPPIRDIGVISAVGIVAALIVFGALIPALKIELDGLLESLGFDRSKRAIGTGDGWFTSMLSVGVVAAKKSPIAVVLLVLVLSAGTTYTATQVDTSFQPSDFFPEDTPKWMDSLPAKLQPSDYTAKENLAFTNDHFVSRDSQAQLLVEGDVTNADALNDVAKAESSVADKDSVLLLSNGEANVLSPLSVMERVAAQNESFNATFAAADTDGDGVPDENVEQVYDELFAVAPDEASRVVHREDGEYEAIRLVVPINEAAEDDTVISEMRDVATLLDGSGTTATATGQSVVSALVRGQLLETLVESLLVTLVAVLAFLAIAYRLSYGSATLGAVTLLPVVFSVSWIVGSMTLLGIPLSVLTAIITGLTIGIGVDYSIHVSERYLDELRAGKSPKSAIADSIAGTGSALFGSAVTTMSGFGVLALAVLPNLQQFGTITALTVAYAFVASVLVLPSLLLLWTRYVDVDSIRTGSDARSGSVAGADGD